MVTFADLEHIIAHGGWRNNLHMTEQSFVSEFCVLWIDLFIVNFRMASYIYCCYTFYLSCKWLSWFSYNTAARVFTNYHNNYLPLLLPVYILLRPSKFWLAFCHFLSLEISSKTTRFCFCFFGTFKDLLLLFMSKIFRRKAKWTDK